MGLFFLQFEISFSPKTFWLSLNIKNNVLYKKRCHAIFFTFIPTNLSCFHNFLWTGGRNTVNLTFLLHILCATMNVYYKWTNKNVYHLDYKVLTSVAGLKVVFVELTNGTWRLQWVTVQQDETWTPIYQRTLQSNNGPLYPCSFSLQSVWMCVKQRGSASVKQDSLQKGKIRNVCYSHFWRNRRAQPFRQMSLPLIRL